MQTSDILLWVIVIETSLLLLLSVVGFRRAG